MEKDPSTCYPPPPMHTGFSLRHFWNDVTEPLLRSINANVIVEIGMGNGSSTQQLVEYAKHVNGFVHSIDTAPPYHMEKFQKDHASSLRIFTGKSLDVLPNILQCDAVLIDGDHNWYTVYNELLIIHQIAQKQGHFPLILVHDTGWPYGRRDQYCDPSCIPAQYRHGYARKGIMLEEDQLVERGGFNDTFCHAMHEGGSRNGVRTAIEDALKVCAYDVDATYIVGGHGLCILVPSSLRAEHPTLNTILQTLQLTPEATAHVEDIEHARVLSAVDSQTHWRSWQLSQKELAEVKQRAWQLDKRVASLTKELQETAAWLLHIQHTRSWRITEPLRTIGQLPYICCSALKDLWTDFGEPLPRLVRFVRHRIVGTFFPVRVVEHVDDTPKASAVFRVGIVITSHNYGRYLADAIKSVLAQTVVPKNIIVVDDGSNDETANVAAQYAEQGVRYMRNHWSAVGKARNAGIDDIHGEYVLCLDADDTLEPDYIEKAVHALDTHPHAAIAYGNIRIFGDERKDIITEDTFNPYAFDQTNSLPTPCLVRREALRQTGGWSNGDTHHGDWVTWRKILALGWTAIKHDAFFGYRKHQNSMHVPLVSQQNYAVRSGLADGKATLFLTLSGREWMWEHTQAFLERQTFPHNRIHLVIVDTSHNEAFSHRVRSWIAQSDYYEQTYIHDSIAPNGLADAPRESVSRHVALVCATLYNKCGRLCRTPLAFVLEDDIIPPDDVYERLVSHFAPPVISVSAAYAHRERNAPVAWTWNEDHVPTDAIPATGVQHIGGTGFGCIAIRGLYFKNTLFSSGPPFGNYDQNFFFRFVIEQDMQALIDWDVRCKHYRNAHDIAEL